jgi:ATP adenylyltransferase
VPEERLWAPWRLDYIKGPKPDECIFCAGHGAGDDERSLVVRRGERCFVMLNAYPYANGHVMVAPYDHVPSVEDLEEPVLAELMALTQEAVRALREAYGPDGFNIGINQGKVAGAGVEDHVHQHVVPRWGGDTNFMPVIGSTRVLPQSLTDAYATLREAFAAAPGASR